MKKFPFPWFFAIAFLAIFATGCESTSTKIEREDAERAYVQLVRNQPAPQFDWSLERHLMIELYIARNNAIATYTYVRNPFTGRIMSWCPSIGFPIPADTQLTNPLKLAGNSLESSVIEQPEPNGLFTSKNTRGTFVMCVNKKGKVIPRYHEADVEAYVTPMREVDGMLVEVEGVAPSLVMDPQRRVTHGAR